MNDLKHQNDKNVIFYSVSIFIIGIIPILVTFTMYISGFGIGYLNYLYENLMSLPSSFSETHPVISKILGNYLKLSPLFSLLFMVLIWNKLKVKKEAIESLTWGKLISTISLFFIMVLFLIFFTYFYSTNLSTSWSKIQTISRNEYLLLLYYIIAFLSIYFCFCLFFILSVYVPYKKLKARI
ncbi:colicin immunity protein Cui [Providencia manganoxydans]|uniref:colicin immunity protein Cui n=1 Tax=Providencia manganoxydans TaxID=2923283 RepID=UPI0034E4609B